MYQDLQGRPAGANKMVLFRTAEKKNEEKSREAGHYIADSVEEIEIRLITDPTLVVVKEVTDEIRAEYAQPYAAFKSAMKEAESGFPVTQWAAITRAQAETLSHNGIKSVEHLATADEKLLEKFGPEYQGLRRKAQLFLERAKDGAASEKWDAEREDLKHQLLAKDEEIQTLRARLAELEDEGSTSKKPKHK